VVSHFEISHFEKVLAVEPSSVRELLSKTEGHHRQLRAWGQGKDSWWSSYREREFLMWWK